MDKPLEKIKVEQPAPAELPESCCHKCKFSRPFDAGGGRIALNCCFNPPNVTHAFMMDQRGAASWPSCSGWPIVRAEQWCGKFERKLDS